jgi:hypothetical protein
MLAIERCPMTKPRRTFTPEFKREAVMSGYPPRFFQNVSSAIYGCNAIIAAALALSSFGLNTIEE